MTNHAAVTQQKLPLQVRSEKRSIPEFLHVAAPSLFPSTYSSNLGVAGTGAGRISKFRMYSRNKGRCLFSSLLLFALIIGDTRDYFPSPACKITIVACAIIVYTVKDGTFPRVLCTCFHLWHVCLLFARKGGGKRGEAKDQTSSLAERKDERRKGRKKHASGKESVCIIDGRKAARRRVLVR